MITYKYSFWCGPVRGKDSYEIIVWKYGFINNNMVSKESLINNKWVPVESEGVTTAATIEIIGENSWEFGHAFEEFMREQAKPSEYSKTKELEATKNHLEDMRKLVFEVKK